MTERQRPDDERPPLASDAAWSSAARPRPTAPLLSIDDVIQSAAENAEAEAKAAGAGEPASGEPASGEPAPDSQTHDPGSADPPYTAPSEAGGRKRDRYIDQEHRPAYPLDALGRPTPPPRGDSYVAAREAARQQGALPADRTASQVAANHGSDRAPSNPSEPAGRSLGRSYVGRRPSGLSRTPREEYGLEFEEPPPAPASDPGAAAAGSEVHDEAPPAAGGSDVHEEAPPVASGSDVHDEAPPAAGGSDVHDEAPPAAVGSEVHEEAPPAAPASQPRAPEAPPAADSRPGSTVHPSPPPASWSETAEPARSPESGIGQDASAAPDQAVEGNGRRESQVHLPLPEDTAGVPRESQPAAPDPLRESQVRLRETIDPRTGSSIRPRSRAADEQTPAPEPPASEPPVAAGEPAERPVREGSSIRLRRPLDAPPPAPADEPAAFEPQRPPTPPPAPPEPPSAPEPYAAAPAVAPDGAEAPPQTFGRGTLDRLAALRDIARKLRAAPESEETLQFIIDTACACTGADAGMLTISGPNQRQVVSGRALGAGPYISLPLRAGGPMLGELVLTRMADGAEFEPEDETFADLVSEYLAKAVAAMRAGTVLSQEEQDFVDRVVEELRSPLAGAVNLVRLVLDGEGGELSETQRRYLTTVSNDTARTLALVEDLVTIAHLRPPELRELEPVAVTPWLRKGLERRRDEAAARGLHLEFAEPATPFVVKGVPSQLASVIDHLLSNAIKFSEPGGHIRISAATRENVVEICVNDEGIGFDSGDATRMLDCYARAINAEAARIPGAGLGLFIVKEIVTNHGGRVWLESRRDEGTQAYVTLPVEQT